MISRPPRAALALAAAALASLTIATATATAATDRPTPRPPAASAGQAELNLVFVLDGLRPDSINQTDTPNLYRLRQTGVDFPNSHAAVPTVTRVNAAVLATGNLPGTNGIVGNDAYFPSVSATRTINTGQASDLLRLRAVEGDIVLTQTLAERLQARGRSFVALGSGSSGSSLLLNPTAPDGTGVMINVGSNDGPRSFPASVGQEMERRLGPAPATATGTTKVDYAIRALNDYVLPELRPDVVMTWMTEPDGTQHERGVGSPEAKAVIRNDDRNIGLVLDRLRQRGLLDKTNIMIISDHGFSVTDYAVNVERELIAAGLKASPSSTDVVVANTGSVALHVEDRDPARIEELSRFLLARTDVDTVFTAAREPVDGQFQTVRGELADRPSTGWVDGTFSLELIGHANAERGADVVVTFPWSSAPNAFGVPGTATTSAGGTSATGARTGNASTHGSFSPFDIANTFFGWGTDFKDGVTSPVPAGNVDVAPTLLSLEGLASGGLDGRVLREALNGGANPRTVGYTTREVTVASEDGRYRGEVTVSEVDGKRYVDQSRRVAADRRSRAAGQ